VPPEVTKSSLSTKARLLWRSVMSTSLDEAAISGAPPARQPRGRLVVIADHRGIDVGEAIDLRGAEKARSMRPPCSQ